MSKYDFIDDAKWFRPYVETEEFKKEIGGVDKNDWLVDIHRTFAEVFDETVSKFHDRNALVFKEKGFTFKQLQDIVYQKVGRIAILMPTVVCEHSYFQMTKFLAPNFFLLLKARNMPNGIEA